MEKGATLVFFVKALGNSSSLLSVLLSNMFGVVILVVDVNCWPITHDAYYFFGRYLTLFFMEGYIAIYIRCSIHVKYIVTTPRFKVHQGRPH